MHIAPPPRLTSMRGVSLASTPSSPSFRDWYKCGSRTRDTRFIRPLLYPTELTCGGMKQSDRAVRVCATQAWGASAPGGLTNPLSLHDRCFDLVTRPWLSAVSNPPSRYHHRLLIAQNDETPVGSAFRGLMERMFRGLPYGQPRNSCELRLTHRDFQRARRRTAGNHEIPCADFQRRALPRAKNA
jgi:hypothetical protein